MMQQRLVYLGELSFFIKLNKSENYKMYWSLLMNLLSKKTGIKKAFVLSTLFLSMSNAQSAGFNGFYLGLHGGGEINHINHKVSDGLPTDNNFFHVIDDKHKLSKTSGVLGLFLGYGKVFSNCFFLGGEIFGNTHSNTKSGLVHNNEQYSINCKRKGGDFGGLGRFGVLTSPKTLLYVGVGVKSAYWEFKTISIENYSTPNKTAHRRGDLLLQLGAEGLIGAADRFAWRLAYNFSPKRTINQRHLVGTVFPSTGRLTNYSKFKVTQHQLLLGVSYRF